MGLELQNSSKEVTRGEQYGKLTVRQSGNQAISLQIKPDIHLTFHQTLTLCSPDIHLTLINRFSSKKLTGLVDGGRPTHYNPNLRVLFWRLTWEMTLSLTILSSYRVLES